MVKTNQGQQTDQSQPLPVSSGQNSAASQPPATTASVVVTTTASIVPAAVDPLTAGGSVPTITTAATITTTATSTRPTAKVQLPMTAGLEELLRLEQNMPYQPKAAEKPKPVTTESLNAAAAAMSALSSGLSNPVPPTTSSFQWPGPSTSNASQNSQPHSPLYGAPLRPSFSQHSFGLPANFDPNLPMPPLHPSVPFAPPRDAQGRFLPYKTSLAPAVQQLFATQPNGAALFASQPNGTAPPLNQNERMAEAARRESEQRSIERGRQNEEELRRLNELRPVGEHINQITEQGLNRLAVLERLLATIDVRQREYTDNAILLQAENVRLRQQLNEADQALLERTRTPPGSPVAGHSPSAEEVCKALRDSRLALQAKLDELIRRQREDEDSRDQLARQARDLMEERTAYEQFRDEAKRDIDLAHTEVEVARSRARELETRLRDLQTRFTQALSPSVSATQFQDHQQFEANRNLEKLQLSEKERLETTRRLEEAEQDRERLLQELAEVRRQKQGVPPLAPNPQVAGGPTGREGAALDQIQKEESPVFLPPKAPGVPPTPVSQTPVSPTAGVGSQQTAGGALNPDLVKTQINTLFSEITQVNDSMVTINDRLTQTVDHVDAQLAQNLQQMDDKLKQSSDQMKEGLKEMEGRTAEKADRNFAEIKDLILGNRQKPETVPQEQTGKPPAPAAPTQVPQQPPLRVLNRPVLPPTLAQAQQQAHFDARQSELQQQTEQIQGEERPYSWSNGMPSAFVGNANSCLGPPKTTFPTAFGAPSWNQPTAMDPAVQAWQQQCWDQLQAAAAPPVNPQAGGGIDPRTTVTEQPQVPFPPQPMSEPGDDSTNYRRPDLYAYKIGQLEQQLAANTNMQYKLAQSLVDLSSRKEGITNLAARTFKVPPYKPGMDVIQYLDQCYLHCRLAGANTDNQILQFLLGAFSQNCGGFVKKIMSNPDCSLRMFLENAVTRFDQRPNATAQFQIIHNLRQGDLTVHEYLEVFEKAILDQSSNNDVNWAWFITQFVTSLRPELRSELQRAIATGTNIATLTQAAQMATMFQNMLDNVRTSQNLDKQQRPQLSSAIPNRVQPPFYSAPRNNPQPYSGVRRNINSAVVVNDNGPPAAVVATIPKEKPPEWLTDIKTDRWAADGMPYPARGRLTPEQYIEFRTYHKKIGTVADNLEKDRLAGRDRSLELAEMQKRFEARRQERIRAGGAPKEPKVMQVDFQTDYYDNMYEWDTESLMGDQKDFEPPDTGGELSLAEMPVNMARLTNQMALQSNQMALQSDRIEQIMLKINQSTPQNPQSPDFRLQLPLEREEAADRTSAPIVVPKLHLVHAKRTAKPIIYSSPMVDVEIDQSYIVRATCDSGAMANIGNQKLLGDFYLHYKEKPDEIVARVTQVNVPLSAFMNQRCKAELSIKLDVEVRGGKGQIDVLIVPEATEELLLGTPALNELGFQLKAPDGESLLVKPTPMPRQKRPSESPPLILPSPQPAPAVSAPVDPPGAPPIKINRVVLAKNVMLKPFESACVPVQYDQLPVAKGESHFFHSKWPDPDEQPYSSADGLLEPSEREQKVIVDNHSSLEVRLTAGQYMGNVVDLGIDRDAELNFSKRPYEGNLSLTYSNLINEFLAKSNMNNVYFNNKWHNITEL